jgi:hypothetical protein
MEGFDGPNNNIARDRPTENPGGMQCELCDEIFIGDESHSMCGVCVAKVAARSASGARNR